MLRTHTCGELNKGDIGKEVELCGWNQSRRDHGGLIFIDIRDRYGLTQIVFNPEMKEAFAAADKSRREDVLKIKGNVVARKEGMENPKLATGEIEVEVSSIDVLNDAETPPIEVEDRVEVSEEMRLKYRYLDLRRPVMNNRLFLRHKAAQAAREFLNKDGFMEIETPLLIRATPEGARDYIVPSRVNTGDFYSLPQSPQLYKQILMVSGMDKYYQLARCLRDEDLRQDRQPEFTQIDLEMSFVEQEDILKLSEGLIRHIWKKVLDIDIEKNIPRITYKEAMDKYGSDKPDLRFGLELIDVTDIVKESDFGVFKQAEKVKCINPVKEFSRKDFDAYVDFCQKNGAKGMAWMKVTEKGLESNIVKFFNEDIQKKLLEKTKAKKGSALMFIADKEKKTNEILGGLRVKIGHDLELIDHNEFKFCWVTDFPLFERDEDSGKWAPMHHIFSMPKKDLMKFMETDPSKVTGDLYDLVLNGVELGGGSIRIHKKDIQEKVLNVIGMDYKQAEERFGFLLESFKYGAPPHGGIAFGFDRLCALLNGINDIREVMAFPKNKAAECPMDGSPSEVPAEQLKELHLKVEKAKK
ncbi:aspartate--tRNA ligase [Candidatus Woesearchaeota archaeon]|nr:aspartate--tRNA ligase [Candidatus Woesearchaeota archaeon]